MRVAQIIDNVRVGGAQKMQIVLAEVMYGRDVQSTLISLEENRQQTETPDILRQFGVETSYFPGNSLLSIGRLYQVTNFLRQGQFDLIHTHLTYANIIGTIAGWITGIPVIASFRSIKPDPNPLRARLEAFLLRYGSTHLMAVGQATATAHGPRVGNKPIVPIPNSVTLNPALPAEKRKALRRTLVGDPERLILIAVGRLIPLKGFDDLLDAFACVHQQFPSAVLLIAGHGPVHEQLSEQIQRLGLTEHARLLGRRDDISNLLAASDIFVNSSHWEGLSNALLEAMATGLPVVATNAGDTPSVVIQGTGLIVPAKDPHALASALLTLLNNPDQRHTFGIAAREHIACEYNLTRWSEQILALYHSALNGRQEHP